MERRHRPAGAAQRRRDLDEAPGLPLAYASGSVASTCAALRSPSSRGRVRLRRCCRCRRCRSRSPARRARAARAPGSRRASRAARTRRPARGGGGTSPGTRRAAAAAAAPRARLDEQLGDVDDVRDAVILEVRAAAGGVRDDVGRSRPGRLLELCGARDALLEPPGVGVQRAAAALRARHVHVVAVGVQHARGRGVDVAEDDARDAAGHQRDARPVARQVLRRPRGARHGGAIRFKRRERPGRGQPAESERRAQPPPVREHREDQPRARSRSSGPAAVVAARRGRASARSAGRTARPTGTSVTHAMQPRQRSKCSTTVSVSGDRAVDEALHQVDPPARRVHLLVPERVGRARRQAEAAVDAVGDQLGLHIASSDALGERAPRSGSRTCST